MGVMAIDCQLATRAARSPSMGLRLAGVFKQRRAIARRHVPDSEMPAAWMTQVIAGLREPGPLALQPRTVGPPGLPGHAVAASREGSITATGRHARGRTRVELFAG